MKNDTLFDWRRPIPRRSPRRVILRSAAVSVIAVLSLAATSSWAQVVTNGDFQTSQLLNYDSDFGISTNLNTWTAIGGPFPQYTVVDTGSNGGAGDYYALHRQTGGGSDEKLVQFIDATGIAGPLTLNFDYIYARAAAAQANPQGRVSLIGIAADRSYVLNGGSGTDGIFNANGDFNVAPPDTLLAQATLPYSDTWKTAVTLVANVAPGTFQYIGVIVQSGCFKSGETTECDPLRGTDNFVLLIDDEGPYTKHVEGVPNAAIFNTPFAITATVDDTETGNSTIKAAEYKILDNGFEVVAPMPMAATDGSFDMPFEDVSAVHNPGLPVGQYEICVRGQDVALNWGEWSCSNFVTYNPISQSGFNLPISNECAIFYTLENPGAENEIRTLRYGEAIVFDTDIRIDLKLNISHSGKVNFNFSTKANGQGTGVTSGILYNLMLNSVLREKTDLSDFDPSTFTFNVRAKIVGQAQEVDGYGILNGAQNNAELFFKLRTHYANGSFTHETYDFGVECAGDPWTNLMENKNLETREPVTRGFGDDWNKYAWAGADFKDALIVATKNAWYDIFTYINGDGNNAPGGITNCVNNPPNLGTTEYPEIYWRFACMEIFGNDGVRDSNGAQIWRFSYKNKRWQLVYDALPDTIDGQYVQGFRDMVVHEGKLYVAADLGAFISGASYVTPFYFPGVRILVSEDGINFNVLEGCPADLCGGSAVPPVNNVSIRALASKDGKLWIGTLNNTGGEIWWYDAAAGMWSANAVFELGPTFPIVGELEPYGDHLYIGLGGALTVDDAPNNDYLYRCGNCENFADYMPVPDLPNIDPNSLFVIKLATAFEKLWIGTVNFVNGFSFLSFDSNAAPGDEWDIIVDGPNDGGMFDEQNIYLWSFAGPVNGRIFAGTFNPATITEIPRGTAELWYSDDGVSWTQYPMPIGWSLLGYGIRNMVVGDDGKSLFLLSATNMVAPDLVEVDNPLRAGTEIWQIRDTKVASPSGGGSKGKGKGKP